MICAVNQDAEEAFKKTVEVDRLIDKLRDANPIEVSGYVLYILIDQLLLSQVVKLNLVSFTCQSFILIVF